MNANSSVPVDILCDNTSFDETTKYKLVVLSKVPKLIQCSDWKKLMSLVGCEQNKIARNLEHIGDGREHDPRTLAHCISWARTHVDITVNILNELIPTVPFSEWKKFMVDGRNTLGKAASDLQNAEAHRNDIDALAEFLSRGRKHTKAAIDTHIKLMRTMQLYV